MRLARNMRVRRLVLWVLPVVAAVCAVQVGLLLQVREQVLVFGEHHMQASRAALVGERARYDVAQVQQFLTDASLTGDRGALEEARAHRDDALKLLTALARLEPERAGEIEAIGEGVRRLFEVGTEMTKAYLTVNREAGNAVMKRPEDGFDASAAALAAQIDALVKELGEHAHEAARETEAATRRSVAAVLVSYAVALALIVALAVLLYQKVMPPLERLERAMQGLAAGEASLDVVLPVEGRDEIGSIADGFNRFVAKIRALVEESGAVGRDLKAAGSELAQRNGDVHRRMERLREEMTQVAAAMNEMVASVKEVARNVAHASDEAQQSDANAKRGAEVIMEVVARIGRLAEEMDETSAVIHKLGADSQNIGRILEVISGIAEQTNLLALNAAIEAARAGEHGRGFAVVADEVRALARRTREATAEIQDMIGQIRSGAEDAVRVMERGKEQIEAAVQHAELAGRSLEQITSSASAINDLTSQIAAAAEEQSSVAEDIHRSIDGIGQLVAEVTEASAGTAELGQRLAEAVARLEASLARFRLAARAAAGEV
ncbi:methyl-accepting chemotaxis protein [Inmirania thermothiophila]|uniref:Methyl-accepting chemotaxis protein n=1 Tax=Inmirania thermothiophila TaxID=1750597 RepID=A0A3N1Y106_9GAMM|nr:methyl-accepting chemotaxis protein [Inmirania thermothiophila]ROR32514.1 methyl-accepting chemotaxis protein [Inmirania thermothiophila]